MMASILVGLIIVLSLLVLAAAYSGLRSRHYARAHPPCGQFVHLDGLAIHYVDCPAPSANGPALVFIHGASANLRDQMAAFRSLLEGRYRLVFVDRPGHGWSARGSRYMASPTAQAKVVDDLLAHLAIERAIVVGHSWGASAAAALCLNHRARIAAALFLAPATHPWDGGLDWYYRIATIPVLGWLFTRTMVVPVGEALLARTLACVFDPDSIPHDYERQTGLKLILRPAEFHANARDVAHLRGHLAQLSNRYGDIWVPATVITGDADAVLSADFHAAALSRDLADAKMVVLGGVGHMLHHPRGPAIVDEIVDLTRRDAAARIAAQ